MWLATNYQAARISADQANEHRSTTITGKVRYLKQGKEIAIDIRPQVEKTYKLSDSSCAYHLDPDIQVGTNVTVIESYDDSGGKVVTIQTKR